MPADLAPPVGAINNRVYHDYGSPNSTLSFKCSNGEASGSISHESVVRFVLDFTISEIYRSHS